MKKVLGALAITAVFAASAFAELKFSGYVRAGFSMNFDQLDTNGDKKGDTAESTTKVWQAGDYFGAGTRSRLNFAWTNEDKSAGFDGRLQYTGTSENWSLDKISYAQAYAKPFGGNLTVAAGKLRDVYFVSDGWEGFTVIHGTSGFQAAFTPTFNDALKGLAIGGGANVDFLSDVNDGTDDDGNPIKKHRAAKNGVFFAGKYSNDLFNVASQFSLAGAFFANAGVNLKDTGLAVQAEFAHQGGTALSNNWAGYKVSTVAAENIAVLWAEYTGVDNLTAGVTAYLFLADINDSTTGIATVNPAVRYDINSDIAASVEGTVHFSPLWDKKKIGAEAADVYVTVVPAIYLKATSNAEISIWGKISSDTDQEHHAVGTGVIFNF